MNADSEHVVHGLTVSYFTRKVTGLLDYKHIPWRLQPSVGMNKEAWAAGWNGGIPVITTPNDGMIWDSTAVNLHLDHRYPELSIVPPDPVHRFLDLLLDDFSDEWFYRHAVGTRWLFDENVVSGSWDIAREGSLEVPGSIADVRAFVTQAMTDCLPRLGTTPDNIGAWIDESLRPFQRAFSAHVLEHGFIFGGRPSLADFAFFGGNAAHFINDPVCRKITEEQGTEVVRHTHALMTPRAQTFGDWLPGGEVPQTLVDLVAEAGRHYLPWVAQATVDGQAVVPFENGVTATIPTTNFLTEARSIMLARYRDARCDALDEILDEAGVLSYYADHVDQATSIPDPTVPPRPTDNRPYPAGR